jgi:hypothetical protein
VVLLARCAFASFDLRKTRNESKEGHKEVQQAPSQRGVGSA